MDDDDDDRHHHHMTRVSYTWLKPTPKGTST
jgi:hypothetical protein